MKKISSILPVAISYFFVLLFCYAGISKILDFENFQVQIAQSPLLSAYAGFISYTTIISEMMIVALLIIPKTRLIGLYASLGTMSAFSIYIYLILNYSDFVPCSCGGILDKMGWTEHLIFNIVCAVLAIAGILTAIYKSKTPKYRIIIYQITTIVFSCGLVVYLFYSSEYIIKKENNFTRRFLLHPLKEENRIQLPSKYYYFAGTYSSFVYLGDMANPLSISKTKKSLGKVITIKIALAESNYKFRFLQLHVKSPFYYLADGTVPIIYRGKLGDVNAKVISKNDAYFSQIAVVDSNQFVIRTRNKENFTSTLGILKTNATKKFLPKPDILRKQIDGVFDVDGYLSSNQNGNEFVYCYAYRNEFMIMNSDLQITKRLNTIDTTKHAKISSIELSNGVHKLNAPPEKVNIYNTISEGLFFNVSNIIGKNESRNQWKKASIVDIYKTINGEYVGSFYIYNKNGEKLRSLKVYDESLYVLQGEDLVRYSLRNSIMKHFTKK